MGIDIFVVDFVIVVGIVVVFVAISGGCGGVAVRVNTFMVVSPVCFLPL